MDEHEYKSDTQSRKMTSKCKTFETGYETGQDSEIVYMYNKSTPVNCLNFELCGLTLPQQSGPGQIWYSKHKICDKCYHEYGKKLKIEKHKQCDVCNTGNVLCIKYDECEHFACVSCFNTCLPGQPIVDKMDRLYEHCDYDCISMQQCPLDHLVPENPKWTLFLKMIGLK